MKGNIVLVGFKGSGKTVIGRLLAERLAKTFVDVDEIIKILYEQATSQRHTVRFIFEHKGEVYFRELEHEALKEISTGNDMVVSTGGGSVVDKRNRTIIRALGTVVYLDVEEKLLFKRSMQKSLAAIYDKKDPEGSFKALYAERKIMYRSLADLHIAIMNEKKEELVERIVERL